MPAPWESQRRDGASAERGVLRVHVAHANPAWTGIRESDDVLVIFGAADTYISPRGYPSNKDCVERR